MNRMSRVSAWIWAVFIWTGGILFSSTSLASQWAEHFFSFLSEDLFSSVDRNSSSYGVLHLIADKGFHVSLFCVLAILLWLALRNGTRKPWIIILCGALVGSSSEFFQRFFPDRDPALRDVLINIAGTALGVAFCLVASRIQRRFTGQLSGAAKHS